jgi:hypothetical protein
MCCLGADPSPGLCTISPVPFCSTFALEYPEGPKKVQARYTFIYKKTAGEWKIVEHHSSAMPEKKASL